MWPCPHCQALVDDDAVLTCWNCGVDNLSRVGLPDTAAPATAPSATDLGSRVCYRFFRSDLADWDTRCRDAAVFATSLGRQRLITINHGEERNSEVIVVWYWSS